MSLFKTQKKIGKAQEQERKAEVEKVIKTDVNIYYTDGEKPDQNFNAKVKVYESMPKSSRIEVNGKDMILDCSVESTIIEKEMIGQSWLGWFAAGLLFIGFDIYRLLHELLDVTWKVGLADALYLLVFGFVVAGWSISLSQKTYREMNLIFDEETGTYSSFVTKHKILREQESIQILWTCLAKLQEQFIASKETFWIGAKLTETREKINTALAEMLQTLDMNYLNPSDIASAWQGLDDIVNIFEPELVEPEADLDVEKAKQEKEKLLQIIYAQKQKGGKK
ncbi:MAG: hypothetical protein ACTSYG_07340 [Candidatus Heimdallarchaeota archaeon]